MGADSTLVNAAFKESQSRYAGDVIDMKPLYDSNAAINTKATNLILGAIDIYSKEQKVIKDGVKAQLDIFNQNAEAANVKYYKNGEPMSQLVINAVQDKIKELQAEFELVNTFGKSDNAENERARARLNASLKQIISSVNYDRTMLSGADTFFKDINTQAVTAENLFIANTLVGESYSAVGFDDNFSLVYFVDTKDKDGNVISSNGYTSKQMEKMIPKLDLTAQTRDQQMQNTSLKLGADDGLQAVKGSEPNFNHVDYVSNFTSVVTSPGAFETLALNSTDGKPSFKQSLEKSGVVLNDLISLLSDDQIQELDMLDGKDDDAFQKDFSGVTSDQAAAVAANLKEFISILTDKSHPNFDLERSTKLLANYKADLVEKDYNYNWQNEYDKKYPKPSYSPSGMTYAQALAKQNLETAVSNVNSTYTEILKDDKGDDSNIGKQIAAPNKQGTFVELNKDKSGNWLWYGYINGKLNGEKWPMGTGGKPDPKMVNWLTNSQVMSVSGTTGSAGSLD
jgi:hypothetical protein